MSDEKAMRAARLYAQWELGHPGWADKIIQAYNNPDRTMEYLRAEGMKAAAGSLVEEPQPQRCKARHKIWTCELPEGHDGTYHQMTTTTHWPVAIATDAMQGRGSE